MIENNNQIELSLSFFWSLIYPKVKGGSSSSNKKMSSLFKGRIVLFNGYSS